MAYWNRIDLHQHTNHDIDCRGKHVNNNYTHYSYFKWLQEEKVKLKAVTCHNNIDVTSHVKHAIISDLLEINHLVGVEIDYKFEELKFHAITILSPNVDIILFSHRLNEIRNSKGTEIYFNKEDFCKLHSNIEFIFIPHAIKDKGILEQKIGKLEKNTIDWVVKSLISGVGEPILFENTRDFYIYTVVEKINSLLKLDDVEVEISGYVGDDYKFDNDKLRKEKIKEKIKYAINSLPTYRGLEIALRNSKTRFSLESQIINREKFIKSIKVPSNSVFEESVLSLSPGLNVIIGNSGSGKTLLLNEIYYELTNNNLKAAIKNNSKIIKGNQYKSKVGDKPFLDICFDKSIDKNSIKILEIPNIYSEILKSQNDDSSEIPSMFGINDITSSNKIMIEYKSVISKFISNINNKKLAIDNGNQNFINITSAIEYIKKNKIESSNYNLNKSIFNDKELDMLRKKEENIKKIISDYSKIEKYFDNIKGLITTQNAIEHLKNIRENYKLLMIDLEEENKTLQKQKNKILLEKLITNIINSSIEKVVELLGNKEKTVRERKEIITRESNNMISNIKNAIICEQEAQKICLKFPYDSLREELKKNCNEYARLTLSITESDLKNISLFESPLFDLSNVKTKAKEIGISNYNFFNTEEVKNTIVKLNKVGISFSNILVDVEKVPKNIELYLSDKEEWRLIENINKGDIAKKSIEYYFNKLVKDNQPDIILIDQPENDVDKTFISTTLSRFIKNQKADKQIIVTSHDAIVAINSDVNKIIQAEIDDNNKIKYESYDLEYVEEEKLVATNKVSTILDGGKSNIKLRYQIYGGELNYENRNI